MGRRSVNPNGADNRADIIFRRRWPGIPREYDMRDQGTTGPARHGPTSAAPRDGAPRDAASKKDDEISRELALPPSKNHDECNYGEGLSHELAFISMAGLLELPGLRTAAPVEAPRIRQARRHEERTSPRSSSYPGKRTRSCRGRAHVCSAKLQARAGRHSPI